LTEEQGRLLAANDLLKKELDNQRTLFEEEKKNIEQQHRQALDALRERQVDQTALETAKQLVEILNEIIGLSSTNVEYQNKIEKLTSLASSLKLGADFNKNIENIIHKLESIADGEQKRNEELNKLKREYAEVIEAKESEILQLGGVQQRLNLELDKKNQQIKQLENNLRQMQQEKQNDLQKLQTELAERDRTITELRKQNNELEAENKALHDQNEKNKNINEELERHKSVIIHLLGILQIDASGRNDDDIFKLIKEKATMIDSVNRLIGDMNFTINQQDTIDKASIIQAASNLLATLEKYRDSKVISSKEKPNIQFIITELSNSIEYIKKSETRNLDFNRISNTISSLESKLSDRIVQLSRLSDELGKNISGVDSTKAELRQERERLTQLAKSMLQTAGINIADGEDPLKEIVSNLQNYRRTIEEKDTEIARKNVQLTNALTKFGFDANELLEQIRELEGKLAKYSEVLPFNDDEKKSAKVIVEKLIAAFDELSERLQAPAQQEREQEQAPEVQGGAESDTSSLPLFGGILACICDLWYVFVIILIILVLYIIVSNREPVYKPIPYPVPFPITSDADTKC
jgi:chromosome segregation ATPase